MLNVQCPTAVPLCPLGTDGDAGLARGGFHSDSHEERKIALQTCMCSSHSKKKQPCGNGKGRKIHQKGDREVCLPTRGGGLHKLTLVGGVRTHTTSKSRLCHLEVETS